MKLNKCFEMNERKVKNLFYAKFLSNGLYIEYRSSLVFQTTHRLYFLDFDLRWNEFSIMYERHVMDEYQ